MRAKLLALCSLLATVACSRGAGGAADSVAARSPGEEAREVAVSIDRAAPTMERQDWTSTMGDATASLSAFSAGGKLRLIRERLDQGDHGVTSSRYYFADGRLRYFESQGDVVAPDSTGKGTVRRKERVVMAFDIPGTLVDGSRRLDSERVSLDDARVQGVLTRAQELQRQQATAPAAKGATAAKP